MFSGTIDDAKHGGTIAMTETKYMPVAKTESKKMKKINALIESHEVYSEEEDEKNLSITTIAAIVWVCLLIGTIVGMAVYTFGKFGTAEPVTPSAAVMLGGADVGETLRHVFDSKVTVQLSELSKRLLKK